MIYDAFDVVVVPFPFTERRHSKRRPALVISGKKDFNAPSGQLVFAMITTAVDRPWPLDCPILDKEEAGLRAQSVVRMKLFTLDSALVLQRLGALSGQDQRSVRSALAKLLG